MRSPQEVFHARGVVAAAHKFLMENETEGAAALTFEFHAGALHALEWMLKTRDGKPFDGHLKMLEKNLRLREAVPQ